MKPLQFFLVFLSLFVSACGNVSPVFPVDIDAPAQNGDLYKVEAVAKKLGFVRTKNPIDRGIGDGGELKYIYTWIMSGHVSTVMIVTLVVQKNRYRIMYGDSDVDGGDFVGLSCTCYLDFVDALKKEFGNEQYRLKFDSETCSHRKG